MKLSEILEKSGQPLYQDDVQDDHQCECCRASDLALEVLKDEPELRCPGCQVPVTMEDLTYAGNRTVVGVYNGHPQPDHDYQVRHVYNCPEHHCLQTVAVKLEPIIYNANHDVHYTGRGYYIPTHFSIEKSFPEEFKEIQATDEGLHGPDQGWGGEVG